MARRRRHALAMSLVEVMIAASILGVGATGVLSSYSTLMGINKHTDKLNSALRVGQAQMELLLGAGDRSPLIVGLPAGSDVVNHLGRPTDAIDGDVFAVTSQLSLVGAPSGFLTITVTVSWAEQGRSRTTQLTAMRQVAQ